MAGCLIDGRQAGKVEPAVRYLLRQRRYGIACGYADENSAARFAEDPLHKVLLDRDPISGAALARQATLSRFENAPRRAELYRIAETLADSVIERHRRRLGRRCKHLTIDLDPTDDATHGAQQLTFFNRHYDTCCYLPVAGFVTFNHEPEQYLFSFVLRPGNAPATRGAIGILRRVRLRFRSPYTRAICMALLPLMNPTTCDTAYLGGIAIFICTWSDIKCPLPYGFPSAGPTCRTPFPNVVATPRTASPFDILV